MEPSDHSIAWARRLRVRHLESFLILHDAGTLSAAATRLHMTQSAVSHWLSEIEDLAGVRLAVRGRRLQLTPAGEAVAAGVRMHQRLTNSSAKPASGPECSVPATGCAGMKSTVSGRYAAMSFSTAVLTEPTSETIAPAFGESVNHAHVQVARIAFFAVFAAITQRQFRATPCVSRRCFPHHFVETDFATMQ